MKEKLIHYIRAGYSGINIVSFEEARVEAELSAVAKAIKTKTEDGTRPYDLHAWSITTGVIKNADTHDKATAIPDTQDPLAMLKAFDGLEDGCILLARDFHMFLADPNPMLFRQLKDSLTLARGHNRVLVICGCQLKLPMELEKEITVIDFALPTRDDLNAVMNSIAKTARVKVNDDIRESLIDAATGLTTNEAENAYSLSIIETKEVVASVVAREKATTIRKNGLLEIVHTDITLEDIGGLDVLKRDLTEKRDLFTQDAI